MSHIGSQLAREMGIIIDHGRQDTEYVKRLWHEVTHPAQYHADIAQPKGTDVSVIDTVRNDIERVLEGHKAEVESGLTIAAKVAANPLAQTALGLVHVPPSLLSRASEWLLQMEAEFAKLVPDPVTPAPPAEPTAPAGAPDPQLQTGIAV